VKKSNPRPRGRPGARRISSAETERDLSTAPAWLVPAEEFWIHVDEHGAEHRFEKEPWRLPTLRVVAAGGVEYTRTANVGDESRIVAVRPRGRGWHILCYGSDSDNFSVWLRKAVRP
jgi:hypothetical protein